MLAMTLAYLISLGLFGYGAAPAWASQQFVPQSRQVQATARRAIVRGNFRLGRAGN